MKSGAREILLTGNHLSDVNSFQEPRKVAPREMAVDIHSPEFTKNIPANAFVVLRIPAAP